MRNEYFNFNFIIDRWYKDDRGNSSGFKWFTRPFDS